MSEATFFAIIEWCIPWIFRPFIIAAIFIGVTCIVFLVVGLTAAIYIDFRDDYRHHKSQRGG